MTQVDDCEFNREECWKQNVLATQYLVAAAEKLNAQVLIHVSTDFIFDGTAGPLDETAKPTCKLYGESKLAAEQAVTQSQLSMGYS